MNIHFLQHVAYEGPGYIASWLESQHHIIRQTLLYEADPQWPNLNDTDALLILGGPMGFYDDYTYPWLSQEKALIEDFIQAGKKVLGICLGAQLMAVCLGAQVYTAAHKEIGWFPVTPTEECKKIKWLYDLFSNAPAVFHWHGDTFGIPYDGSLNLLSSQANNHQAFYHSKDVIGLQFHLEMTEQTIDTMLLHGQDELSVTKFVQSAETIRANDNHFTTCQSIAGSILQHWLDA